MPKFRPAVAVVVFALLVQILLVATACSSRRVSVITPATQPLSSFSILEVTEIDSNVPDVELDVPHKMRQELVRKIAETRRFRSVTQQTDETERVLRLESTILSYEKGSRVKRYVIGLGTGKSFMTIRVVLVNKATGKKVFEGDFEGEISGGFLGGSSRSTENAVVDEVRDYFKERFR